MSTPKTIAKVWTFRSDSNANITYETLRYSDGSTSCSCKGWTRRIASNGSRSCKHTRSIDMGTADVECVSSHDYGQTEVNIEVGQTKIQIRTSGKVKPFKQPQRKLDI